MELQEDGCLSLTPGHCEVSVFLALQAQNIVVPVSNLEVHVPGPFLFLFPLHAATHSGGLV